MPALGSGVLAIVFSLCCAFTSLASLGMARSFVRAPWLVASSLSENAYGIYVLHYPFVIWMQFSLLSQQLPAALKFAITLSVALLGSWVATAGLRRTAARRVL
jgi:surface polysaccharide O-acyltransferase-like enzyme